MRDQTSTLQFRRISGSRSRGFEARLRSDSRFKDKDIEILLHLVGPEGLIRPKGDSRPLGDLFNLFNILSSTTIPGAHFGARDILDAMVQITRYFAELFGKPYQLNIVNKLNEPVQYVWAYELHSGLILVDQSTYTQPGATAVLATTTTDPFIQCIQVKQYAISVWDQNDEEVGRIPNLVVETINDIELNKGTWRPCEDTIEIG